MNETSQRLAAYIEFFETLTLDSLPRLEQVFARKARFRDPFNDVTGRAAIRRVFQHMFLSTVEPRFTVTEAAESRDAAFLLWVFTCRVKGRVLDVTGVSHVRFATDGRVIEHIDYWDPVEGFYDRLPVIGRLLRRVRRRLKA